MAAAWTTAASHAAVSVSPVEVKASVCVELACTGTSNYEHLASTLFNSEKQQKKPQTTIFQCSFRVVLSLELTVSLILRPETQKPYTVHLADDKFILTAFCMRTL